MFDNVKKWFNDKFGDNLQLAAENARLKKRLELINKDYDVLIESYEQLSKKYFALLAEKQRGK